MDQHLSQAPATGGNQQNGPRMKQPRIALGDTIYGPPNGYENISLESCLRRIVQTLKRIGELASGFACERSSSLECVCVCVH